MKKFKKIIDNFKLQRSWLLFLRKNKFSNKEWYFVFSQAIGDTYMACSFLPYLIKRGDTVNAIFFKQNQSFIAHLFSEKINIIDVNVPIDLVRKFGKYKKGIPCIMHPFYLSENLLLNLIGYKNLSAYDTFKFHFDISPFELPCKPVFNNFYATEIEDLFSKNKLEKSNTVLICPHANSIAKLDRQLWINIAELLLTCNYCVAIMGEELMDARFKTIDFPLYYAKQFCDYAGYVISIRSGFCDLIATSEAKKIILYPDIEWYSGSLIEGSSLKHHCLNDKNLLELKVNKTEESILKEIANFFKEEFKD